MSKAPDTVSKMPLQLTGLKATQPWWFFEKSHWASKVGFGKRNELRVRDCLGQMFLPTPKCCATCSITFMHSLWSNNRCRSQSTSWMPALLCRARCPLAGGPKIHKDRLLNNLNTTWHLDKIGSNAMLKLWVLHVCLDFSSLSLSLSLSFSHFLNDLLVVTLGLSAARDRDG